MMCTPLFICLKPAFKLRLQRVLLLLTAFCIVSASFLCAGTAYKIPLNYMSATDQKPKRLVLTLKDVRIVFSCSSRTAVRRIKELRQALNKPKPAVITIEHFCNYYSLGYQDTLKQLNLL